MGRDRSTARDRNSARKELCRCFFILYIYLIIISITPYSVRSFLTPPLWRRNSRTKIKVFSGIANGRGNLGLHLLTYVFFICNIQCSFAPRFAPNCVVSSFAPFTGSFLTDSLFTPKWFILSIYLKAYL